MRTVHRVLAVFAVLFGLHLAVTGVLTQLIDLKALTSHAPASDPTMQAIRVGLGGPPNFQVIRDPDYAAAPLPAGFDFQGALAAVMQAERVAIGDAPVSFVELRMLDGRPVGQVASRGQVQRFDVATGAVLGPGAKVSLPPGERPSLRNTVKTVHRMRAYDGWTYPITVAAGLSVCVMLLSGLVLYFRLFAGRLRMGRTAPFWSGGGWWRTLHRVTAVTAGAFLAVVALSGTFLAVNALGITINRALMHGQRPGLTADVSRPLTHAELPGMLRTTLEAYRSTSPDTPVRVLRLRYFAGMPQGVIVTGGEEVRQLAFNAATGRAARLYEPGYPQTGMPFGWQVGQVAKQIHRGDIIGLPGRSMAVFAGLSLLYLSISGAGIYVELWKRRRKAGRWDLFWS